MAEQFNDIIKNNDFKQLSSSKIIYNKTFSDQVITSHTLYCFILSGLTFIDCKFINLDCQEIELESCKFIRCEFLNFTCDHCMIDTCKFFMCTTSNSNLRGTEVIDSDITSCSFNSGPFLGIDFIRCKLTQPTFNDKITGLSSLILLDCEFCNSKKCITIERSYDIFKIFDELEN